jgi:hypothetical protein
MILLLPATISLRLILSLYYLHKTIPKATICVRQVPPKYQETNRVTLHYLLRDFQDDEY